MQPINLIYNFINENKIHKAYIIDLRYIQVT